MTRASNAVMHDADEPFVALEQQQAAGRMGLWIFLANEILFFGGFFAVYTSERVAAPRVFAEASRRLDWLLGGIESLILLLGSFLFTEALRALRAQRRGPCMALLALTAVLGIAFTGLHVHEWLHEAAEGLMPGAGFRPHDRHLQLFFCLYYVLTGFHTLHVLVGVGLIAWLLAGLRLGRWSDRHHPPVELSGLYWHLVDVVWILLYPLFYLVDRS